MNSEDANTSALEALRKVVALVDEFRDDEMKMEARDSRIEYHYAARVLKKMSGHVHHDSSRADHHARADLQQLLSDRWHRARASSPSAGASCLSSCIGTQAIEPNKSRSRYARIVAEPVRSANHCRTVSRATRVQGPARLRA